MVLPFSHCVPIFNLEGEEMGYDHQWIGIDSYRWPSSQKHNADGRGQMTSPTSSIQARRARGKKMPFFFEPSDGGEILLCRWAEYLPVFEMIGGIRFLGPAILLLRCSRMAGDSSPFSFQIVMACSALCCAGIKTTQQLVCKFRGYPLGAVEQGGYFGVERES